MLTEGSPNGPQGLFEFIILYRWKNLSYEFLQGDTVSPKLWENTEFYTPPLFIYTMTEAVKNTVGKKSETMVASCKQKTRGKNE